jgi:hypothetical protein
LNQHDGDRLCKLLKLQAAEKELGKQMLAKVALIGKALSLAATIGEGDGCSPA